MESKYMVYGGLFLIALIAVGGVIVYFGQPGGELVGKWYEYEYESGHVEYYCCKDDGWAWTDSSCNNKKPLSTCFDWTYHNCDEVCGAYVSNYIDAVEAHDTCYCTLRLRIYCCTEYLTDKPILFKNCNPNDRVPIDHCFQPYSSCEEYCETRSSGSSARVWGDYCECDADFPDQI